MPGDIQIILREPTRHTEEVRAAVKGAGTKAGSQRAASSKIGSGVDFSWDLDSIKL